MAPIQVASLLPGQVTRSAPSPPVRRAQRRWHTVKTLEVSKWPVWGSKTAPAGTSSPGKPPYRPPRAASLPFIWRRPASPPTFRCAPTIQVPGTFGEYLKPQPARSHPGLQANSILEVPGTWCTSTGIGRWLVCSEAPLPTAPDCLPPTVCGRRRRGRPSLYIGEGIAIVTTEEGPAGESAGPMVHIYTESRAFHTRPSPKRRRRRETTPDSVYTIPYFARSDLTPALRLPYGNPTQYGTRNTQHALRIACPVPHPQSI